MLSEFYDPSRKYIYLWDDNFLGYHKFNEILDEIESTGRYFQFRQVPDIRLMAEKRRNDFPRGSIKVLISSPLIHLKTSML
jgi:DNA modification methylase